MRARYSDALGVAFRLFQALRVPIPREVIDCYHASAREEPLGAIPLDGSPFQGKDEEKG